MNILISNDDGIAADGIKALTLELSKNHDVYVIAPDRERSAAAHSLTMHTPLRVEELEVPLAGSKRCWITNGTPGDCVKLGISAILGKDEQPDFVISGINYGPNLGFDIHYSGTVSCAMEGTMLGVPSIAVSLATMKAQYEDYKFGAEFVSSLLSRLKGFNFPEKCLLNINIPKLDKEDIAGVAITEMGGRIFTNDYEKRIDPRGKVYYWLAGKLITEPANAPTDIVAIRNNKISITPLTYEMTNMKTIGDLDKILCSQGDCEWY